MHADARTHDEYDHGRDPDAYQAPGGADAPQQDVVVRVEKDGKQVVILRRHDGARGVVVEYDVYPIDTMRIEPLRLGPYLFASSEPASRFVDEVLLALEYLGCTIS
jgi:hypothetical protein